MRLIRNIVLSLGSLGIVGLTAFISLNADSASTTDSTLSRIATVVSLSVAIVSLYIEIARRIRDRDRVAVSDQDLVAQLEQASFRKIREETGRWLGGSAPMPARLTIGDGKIDQAGIPDAFRRLSSGRMAIVGPPGSGKTYLALTVALSLLGNRKREAPVPVFLRLAGWNPDETIRSWLTTQLTTAFRLPTNGAARLIESGRVLPVLDGLDEMPDALRARAATQLSRGMLGGRAMILTCRSAAFDRLLLEGHFADTAVLEIDPLDAVDVAKFLERQPAPRIGDWSAVTVELRRQPHGALAAALSTPFMVSLLVAAYATGGDPRELLDQDRFPAPATLEQYVLERSASAIGGAGADRKAGRAAQQRWLRSLARIVTNQNTTEFSWWRLTEAQPLAVRLTGLALGATTLALVFGAALLTGTTTIVPSIALAASLALGISEPVVSRLTTRPGRPTRGGIARVLAGAVIGAAAWMAGGLPGFPFTPPAPAAWADAAIAGALGGICMAVLMLIRKGPDQRPAQPWHSKRADRSAALVRGAAVAGLCAVVTQGAIRPQWWISAGLAFVVFVNVLHSGSAWGRFQTARVVLAAQGLLPWRLERFLARCLNAGILRSSDDTVQFQNVMMRDGLAAITPYDQLSGPWRAILAAKDALLTDVLARPEVAVFAGTDTARRDQVRTMAWYAVEENLPRVVEAGDADYQRFVDARERLRQALGRPAWTGPDRVYAVAPWIALGVAGWAYGLNALPAAAARLSALVVLGGWVGWQIWRRVRVAAPGSVLRLADAGATLLAWVAASTLIASVLGWTPRVGLALAALLVWPLLALVWSFVRQYPENESRLRDDDPAQWPDQAKRLHRYYEPAAQARRDWLATVARDGIMPLIRGRIRGGRDTLSTNLPAIDTTSLGSVRRTDQLVDTPAGDRVAWVVQGDNMDSASLGISGPRGAGKSTLLQRFASAGLGAAPGGLKVCVSAPTAYDRREFLVYLFVEVCTAILGAGSETEIPRDRYRRWRWISGTAVVIGVALTVGALFWSSMWATATAWRGNPRGPLLVVGIVLTAVGSLATVLLSRRSTQGQRDGTASELAAAGHLRRLRYQLSESRTVTSKVALPAGFEVGGTGQRSRTSVAATYPELVGEFRALLEQAGRDHRPYGNKVVIGIDELDKIGTPEEAEKFLNDLKAIFGIPNCYFLVAVSEDALFSFDRRAVSVRTTFDSAFDLVVSAQPLSVEAARAMVEYRGVGLPEPFMWLCHALSGGLPRDLLRTVLALTAAGVGQGTGRLTALSRHLIAEDITGVLGAQVRQAESKSSTSAGVVGWLARVLDAPPAAPDLEQIVQDPPVLSTDDADGAAIVLQTRLYLYHAVTLLRLFADQDRSVVDLLPDRAAIGILAGARATMASKPRLSWRAITRFRNLSPRSWPELTV